MAGVAPLFSQNTLVLGFVDRLLCRQDRTCERVPATRTPQFVHCSFQADFIDVFDQTCPKADISHAKLDVHFGRFG